MPNIVRQAYGFIILVSIFISSTAPIVHAQTGDDSLSKGSSELLETIRKEELSAAIASGTENSTRWISRPAQATAFPMPSCVFPAGLCGAVNRDGSIAVAPRFDWVDRPSEDRMLVRLKGLYGYVDAAGRTVAEPQYEFAGAYSRGLAEVSINGVSRLIDREGRQVLEPSFARAHAFTADAFWVNDGRRHYTGQAGMAELINFEQTTVTNDIDADGKWGLLARTGEWIRKPEFRSISVFDPNDNSLARVKSDSGWGVIRPDGSWLIEPKFEALGRLYNGLAAARLEGKFGFVDRTGMPIIPPNYEQVGSFTNDALSTARLGGAWGLIDRNGNWVVQPQYQLILHDPYSDNPIVWVRIGEKYGAIDRQGKLVVAPRFTQRGGICEDGWVVGFDNGKQRLVPSEGMQVSLPNGELSGSNCKDPFVLEVDKKYGLMSRTLSPITAITFENIRDFVNGIAVAKADGKFGFLNLDGRWLIEPRFDDANNFVGEYAAVKLNEKYGCVRRNGTWLIEPQFQDAFVPCDVLAKMATDKFGPIAPDRKLPIDERLQKVVSLVPGFYLAKRDGKFGVINPALEWVIDPRWQSLGQYFRNGLIMAKFERGWGFIDASGALTIDPKYDAFTVFSRGIAWVQTGASWCAIDRRGQRIATLECLERNPSPPPGTFSSRMRP